MHRRAAFQDASAAYVLALCHLIEHPGDAAGAVFAASSWARGGGGDGGGGRGGGAAPEVVAWLAEAAAPGPGPAVEAQEGFLKWGFVHAFRRAACTKRSAVGRC
jgi:hypothetical protein